MMNFQQRSTYGFLRPLLLQTIMLLLVPTSLGIGKNTTHLNYESDESDTYTRFTKIGCWGPRNEENKDIMVQLNSICEDCFEKYDSIRIYEDCKKVCFTSKTFKDCVKALDLKGVEKNLQSSIEKLHGQTDRKNPGSFTSRIVDFFMGIVKAIFK